jgi:carboxyl-terminal processing protease
VRSASADQASRQNTRLLTMFAEILDLVRSDYVQPVSAEKLIENALNGMLTGLDPHSAYMNPAEYRELQTETTGKFGGIGLEVTDKDGLLQVVSPIDGSPAALAGIKPGDIVTAVDGKSLTGLTLDEAIARLRGRPDTKVSLVIKRLTMDEPIKIVLTRRIIQLESVKSRLMGDTGVIRIAEFMEQTDRDVHTAMRSLRTQSGGRLRGLVIDLRNDPGGLLDQAVAVSRDFLSYGGIVSIKGRHAEDNDSWSAQPGTDISAGLPIVVLINNGTASAAEIVAGALQDNRRAVVLGEQSFGKGSVQTIIPLRDRSAVRLTTALYYTPSGRSIQGLGITPDVEVSESSKPAPHFGLEREADLRHVLANPGTVSPPPKNTVPAIASRIPKLPPEDWPALDIAKPETDFQLQQALVLLRGMADGSPR